MGSRGTPTDMQGPEMDKEAHRICPQIHKAHPKGNWCPVNRMKYCQLLRAHSFSVWILPRILKSTRLFTFWHQSLLMITIRMKCDISASDTLLHPSWCRLQIDLELKAQTLQTMQAVCMCAMIWSTARKVSQIQARWKENVLPKNIPF